jgi:crossover junction endodeoxyribonuclease RusA
MTALTQLWTLRLPYDRPPLNLNDRKHWAQVAKVKRQLRADARNLALAARLPRRLARVHITLHWQPPDRRRRDTDNPIATLKPLIDGLRDYGLVVDDDAQHVTLEVTLEPPGKPARTWLTIRRVEVPA